MKQNLQLKSPKWFANAEKPYRFEWIILFALLMLITISYTYNDIIATTRHSIMLWDCVFQGKFLNFYSVTYGAATGNSIFTVPQAAAYDFTIYLIFGLWNFPLWALEKLFSVSATENVLCLMWPKMLLALFVVLAAKMMYNIALELKMSRNTAFWVVFAWLSSELLGSSTLLISQYDIFSLLFMLYGFQAYLKNDTRKFVVFFALAASCKYFALLVFVPLLLLRRKKVWKILVNLGLAVSVSVFWRCLFSLGGGQANGSGNVATLLPVFYTWLIGSGLYTASVFLICMIALCMWCYAQPEKQLPDARNAVFAAAAAMLAFVAGAPLYPYWAVLATPFAVLLVFSNTKRFKLNLYLEIAFSLAVLVQQWVMYYWCYSNSVVMPMVWGAIFGKASDAWAGISSLVTMLENAGLPVLQSAASVMLCSAAALLIFNRPGKQTLGIGEDVHVERSVMWVRVILFAGTMLLPVVYYCRYVILYS